MPKVTLATIAEATGLTRSGVSKALAGHPDMSPATIARVQQVARELKYRPAFGGKALRTGRSNIFALAGYEPGGVSQRAYMPLLFDAILKASRRRGYDLVMFDPLGEWSTDQEPIPEILERGLIDGVILLAADPGELLLQTLRQRQVPSIILDDVHGMPTNAIALDLETEGRTAAAHFADNGATRVVYIETLSERIYQVWHEAERGLKAWCRDAGIEFIKEVVDTSWYADDGRSAVRNHFLMWLKNTIVPGAAPVGVFTANDAVGQTLLSAALELGIDVPGQLMVTGHGDDMLCEFAEPPLSSFTFRDEAAELAVEMLCERLQTGDNAPKRTVQTRLIPRGSTSRAPR
jgi:DNA-binding LacI/PurR family transcriptional regulator